MSAIIQPPRFNFIKQVENATITIPSASASYAHTLSKTFDLNNTVIMETGTGRRLDGGSASTTPDKMAVKYELTDVSELTCTMGAADGVQDHIRFAQVIEFYSDAMYQPVQEGTITIAAGTENNTATITSVSDNALIFYAGSVNNHSSSGTAEWLLACVNLLNSTTVKAYRNDSDASFALDVHFYVADII